MSVAVLGAGGWGTALAALLGRQFPVRLWARREALARGLQRERENRAYLPGVLLPSGVEVTANLEEALSADIALLALPSVGILPMLRQLPLDLGIVLCAKGLGAGGERLSSLAAELGFARVAVLSGPNHAEEIGRLLPAATVIASQDAAFAQLLQRRFKAPTLRIYTSADVVGVELGGVLKNVVAVAAGLCDGLKLGDNARASLITRGLREMHDYALSQGAREATLYGLSGLGDLVATATSLHSRNRAAGEALARGQALPSAGVVEGLRTAQLLSEWARQSERELPIVQAVNAVATGQLAPAAALSSLMEREPRAE